VQRYKKRSITKYEYGQNNFNNLRQAIEFGYSFFYILVADNLIIKIQNKLFECHFNYVIIKKLAERL
jgi:hypothetical protein